MHPLNRVHEPRHIAHNPVGKLVGLYTDESAVRSCECDVDVYRYSGYLVELSEALKVRHNVFQVERNYVERQISKRCKE